MEHTITQSFEQATEKISPIKQMINTNLINVKTFGSFGILSGRSNQSKKVLRRETKSAKPQQLPLAPHATKQPQETEKQEIRSVGVPLEIPANEFQDYNAVITETNYVSVPDPTLMTHLDKPMLSKDFQQS